MAFSVAVFIRTCVFFVMFNAKSLVAFGVGHHKMIVFSMVFKRVVTV
jgi:hypothetical protein